MNTFRLLPAIAGSLFLLAACTGQGADEKAAAREIAAGDFVANNMIIYDRGRQSTFGDQMLSTSGDFAPAGPTVIYVIRSVSEAALEGATKDGVHIIEHTAYLVPAGKQLTLDVMKEMKPLGHVDADLSEAEVKALFGYGN